MAMSTSMSVVLLASRLTLAASAPEQAAAAVDQQRTEPLDALVVVHVELDGGEGFALLMHADVVAALREAGVAPDLPEHAPLDIMVSPDLEGLGAYEVVYRHRGDVRETWSCQCTGDELRARVASGAVEVWKAVIAASARTREASLPAPAVALAPPAVDPGARWRERGLVLWVAGVTATAIGTGVLVGTTALLVSDATAGRERNPIALGLFGGSVAMVASGVTLWSFGSHRRKRSRLSGLPTMLHRGVAFMVTASF